MAAVSEISSSVALSSPIAKENILIGALNFLSRNLLLPTDVFRIVSEIRHDPTGDEQDDEFLIGRLAAMQIQQINNSARSDLLKSLSAICSKTSPQHRPCRLSNLKGPASTFQEMHWMLSRFGGRTIQTIAPIAYSIRTGGVRGPHLIIAHKPVLPFWQCEFQFWLPSMTTLLYDGQPEQRKAIREGYSGVLLTHYDLMIKDQKVLSKISWSFLIIDGARRVLANGMRIPLDTTVKAYDYRYFVMVQNLFC